MRSGADGPTSSAAASTPPFPASSFIGAAGGSKGGAEGAVSWALSKSSKQIGQEAAGYLPVAMALACSAFSLSSSFWQRFGFRLCLHSVCAVDYSSRHHAPAHCCVHRQPNHKVSSHGVLWPRLAPVDSCGAHSDKY